jgi:hypothetical protein
MIAAVVFVTVALGSVEVTGDTTCPTPAEVQAKLESLGAVAPTGAHRVTLRSADTGLHLELTDVAGAALASKTLAGETRCPQLADAAAAVIAAWLAELAHPPADLPLAEEKPIEKPRPAPPPRSEPSVFFEVSLGMSASWAGSLAAGGLLSASLSRAREGFGGHLAVAAHGHRQRAVSDGTLGWERFSVSAGPHLGIGLPFGRLELSASGLVGLLSIDPQTTSGVATAELVEPGWQAGVRVIGSAGVWAGLLVTGWVKPAMVTFPVSGEVVNLPQLEALLAIGVAFGTK